jgi:hypothetical protein
MRRYQKWSALLLLAGFASACGNNTARAPNPTTYEWPDSMTYRIRLTWESDRGAQAVARPDESKRLQLVVRNDRYLVWNDSLAGSGRSPGSRPLGRQIWPEDTLHYFVRLSRLGEIIESVPDCDPVVPECRAALPSALPLEMRRIIPRLPVWWPPKGHEWVDTLAFDDLPRARGSRGSDITHYRAARDTVLAGRGYWVVTWSSVRRVVLGSPSGATNPSAPVEEQGTVYVEKERLIPACAVWTGAPARSPDLQATGATGTRFRGRACLAGSSIDSLVVAR